VLPVDRQQKEEAVSSLRKELENVTSVVVTDYRGLDVSKVVDLRRQLNQASVAYKVVKNTLAKLAIEGTDKEFLGGYFKGPTAIAWSVDDPVAPAKVLTKFAKENEELEIKVGYLTGSELDVAGIKALADLPSMDELRSKFLSVLNGPAQSMVTVMSQVLRNFLLVFKQKADQGE
jgi:large subunit ribosomal protein L10